MRLKKIALLFFVVCFLLIKSSPIVADSVDGLYDKAAQKYHKLYEKTEFREQADNWLKTIKQFQLIYMNYPRHSKAPQALYNIGRLNRSLFRLNGKAIYLDRSNIAFRKLVSEYPDSPLADNGQYLLAENYEIHYGDKNLAYLEYEKVIKLYPNRFFAKKAREKLKELQPPRKDFHIAQETVNTSVLTDLTKTQYGGLSEEENSKIRESVLITKVDYWSTADWSRMVINSKGEVRYLYKMLKADEKHPQKRIFLDVLNSHIPLQFKRRIAANDGLITQARIAQFDQKTVRIVLDMASLEKIKVFHFKLPNQYKIVIDILGKTATEGLKTASESGSVSIKPKDAADLPGANTQVVSLSKAFGLKVKKIIIDPGHGGKDPGAIAFKVREKDIALEISLSLKKLIEQNHPDIQVLLTRKHDKYVKLEARTAFANQNRGDLFLSIHLNASRRSELRGVETYYLNLTSDNEALELAAKENQTSLKSLSDLQTILNDLMTNSKILESRELAEKVQSSIIIAANESNHK
ncbi:N-acetylmuramoyl-L-alanine amidase, partial [bacterium]|nr:N-acetylmuramoyl-L-alanine amidase [bacterium]